MTTIFSRIAGLALLLCISTGAGLNNPSSGAEAPEDLKEKVILAGVEEIVFANRQVGSDSHWYANFGYFAEDEKQKAYRAMGRLSKLNLRSGKITVLLDAPEGTIRDPQVHYDGKKILFCWRKAGSDFFHLFEIDTDGRNLRQLTDGPYDDLEPTYVADGGIVFCSSRCNRWVPCWMVQVAILYRCDGDGGNIRQISSNIEQENTPWPLPDGRILYERWEYVDRSRVGFHHLWSSNPDGTGQMVYYGNMHPNTLMIDAKPIPDSENKVLAVFSPGHGKREHAGAITIVSAKSGPDEQGSARRVSKQEDYRDPYPLSKDCFLVAEGSRLLAMDDEGNTEELYCLPADLVKAGVLLHEPRPVMPRQRERMIPPRVDLSLANGQLLLTDVYEGRQMQGVKRGEIKSLIVLETLPKPINFTGKMLPLSYGGTFQLERILGTVDVEPDGSAYFEVPANRSIFFVAMDSNNLSVKRMQSFLTVMPGETTSCVGCHEQRTRAPQNRRDTGIPLATRHLPQKIKPIEGIPDVFDFHRDIQPILDRHCLKCHDYDKRSGGVILSGDHGPVYSHSFYTLTYRQEFVDGRDVLGGNLPPHTIGTSASPLMKKMDGSHNNVQTTAHERDMVRYWIESAAPYIGTYGALGNGMIGGYPKSQLDTSERQWPSAKAAAKVIERRCVDCHNDSMPLPRYLSDNYGITPSNLNLDDPRARFSRHLLFNLTRPEKSLVLLAPLSKKAGGYGLCKSKEEGNEDSESNAVFSDTSDGDYQKILMLCRDGKDHLARTGRFDIEGFRPPSQYVRELRKYGILPRDTADNAAIDTYAIDQAYWRSLWWQPLAP